MTHDEAVALAIFGPILYLLIGTLLAMIYCYATWRWYVWLLFILFWPPLWWSRVEADYDREAR